MLTLGAVTETAWPVDATSVSDGSLQRRSLSAGTRYWVVTSRRTVPSGSSRKIRILMNGSRPFEVNSGQGFGRASKSLTEPCKQHIAVIQWVQDRIVHEQLMEMPTNTTSTTSSTTTTTTTTTTINCSFSSSSTPDKWTGFLQAGWPSCQPNNIVKALKEIRSTDRNSCPSSSFSYPPSNLWSKMLWSVPWIANTGCLQIQRNKFPGDFQTISRRHFNKTLTPAITLILFTLWTFT